MSNAAQLFLLADHIKLSLLERQRAISLNLEPNSQDAHISRSLESLRESIDKLSTTTANADSDSQLTNLRTQYNDLSRQFHGDNPTSTATTTLNSPNTPSLSKDFTSARTLPNKSVRFRDSPSPSSSEEEDPNRASLFPSQYTDEPSDQDPDPSELSNQQIHAYHTQVIQSQDEQLDRLGESIGRQRHLSMQIGDELEGQVALLDEVDEGVDRHQTRLDVAQRRIKGVTKKARENWGITTILVLIVILVFLIAVLK